MKANEIIIGMIADNPGEILMRSSNYLALIINGEFREFQIDYRCKRWYEFKTTGKANSPVETFVVWI